MCKLQHICIYIIFMVIFIVFTVKSEKLDQLKVTLIVNKIFKNKNNLLVLTFPLF